MRPRNNELLLLSPPDHHATPESILTFASYNTSMKNFTPQACSPHNSPPIRQDSHRNAHPLSCSPPPGERAEKTAIHPQSSPDRHSMAASLPDDEPLTHAALNLRRDRGMDRFSRIQRNSRSHSVSHFNDQRTPRPPSTAQLNHPDFTKSGIRRTLLRTLTNTFHPANSVHPVSSCSPFLCTFRGQSPQLPHKKESGEIFPHRIPNNSRLPSCIFHPVIPVHPVSSSFSSAPEFPQYGIRRNISTTAHLPVPSCASCSSMLFLTFLLPLLRPIVSPNSPKKNPAKSSLQKLLSRPRVLHVFP